jgi:hypothetical protein
MRRHLAALLCALVLGLGLATALIAARNRARAHELDRLHQWCEAFARRNELWRAALQAQEWKLLQETHPAPDLPRRPQS